MAAEYEAFVNRLKELRTEAAESGKDDGHGGVGEKTILDHLKYMFVYIIHRK